MHLPMLLKLSPADPEQRQVMTTDTLNVVEVVASGLNRLHLDNTAMLKRRLRQLVCPMLVQQYSGPSHTDILAKYAALKPKRQANCGRCISIGTIARAGCSHAPMAKHNAIEHNAFRLRARTLCFGPIGEPPIFLLWQGRTMCWQTVGPAARTCQRRALVPFARECQWQGRLPCSHTCDAFSCYPSC